MPKKNDRTKQDYSKYAAMTSEELARLLRLDSEAPEGNELDIDTLLYITGVLAEREKTSNNTGKTAQEAWMSFQQNYMPEEEELAVPAKDTKPVRSHPWVRRGIAAAAAIVLVVLVPLTAKALNWEKIWDAVAMWARETFSFVWEGQTNVDSPDTKELRPFVSLQGKMDEMGDDPSVVPTWIPDGYVLDHIDIDESPMQRSYIALYKNGERSINICVCSCAEIDPERIEINEDIIEIYDFNDTEFYILSNNGWVRAVWTQDSYECYISGQITIEEIKEMIDSIEKG